MQNVPFGTAQPDLNFTREGKTLVAEAQRMPAGMRLASLAAGAKVTGNRLRIPLPDVEFAISSGLPAFGEDTRQLAWAEITLDRAWVCNDRLGCGFVAGYGPCAGAGANGRAGSG